MCVHFFKIDANRFGVCKFCGEPKDFKALQLADKGWRRLNMEKPGRKVFFGVKKPIGMARGKKLY